MKQFVDILTGSVFQYHAQLEGFQSSDMCLMDQIKHMSMHVLNSCVDYIPRGFEERFMMSRECVCDHKYVDPDVDTLTIVIHGVNDEEFTRNTTVECLTIN